MECTVPQGVLYYVMKTYNLPPSLSPLASSLIAVFTNCAIETSIIFLPLFAQDIGASKLDIGIIGGAYGIAYAASSWFFGHRSDRKGRVFYIRLGLGLGILALAAQTMANSAISLMVIRSVVGLCLGISAAALMAYNFEAGGSTGRFASFGSLGWLLGAIVAIFVPSYYKLFLISAVSCALGFLTSLLLKEHQDRIPLEPVTLDVFRRNTRIYVPFFLRHTGANMAWVVLPLFFASLGASKPWIAILSGINTGGQFIAMMFVERFKEARLFVAGFALSALVFLSYGLSTYYLQLIPVQALLACSWSCLYVGALLLLLRNNEERATATGILFSTISMSGAIGPFLGGLVAQLWGYQPLMFLSAALSLSGLGMAITRPR